MSTTPPSPKTVLYLSHASERGGAEHVLSHLLGALDRTRYRPLVLLAKEGETAEFMRETGVATHVLPMTEAVRATDKDTLGTSLLLRPAALARQAAGTLRYAFKVADFARRHDVDLIHTNSMKAHLYGGLAGRLAGRPVVWHMHDRVHPSYLPRPAVWAVRALARLLPTRVAAISESVRRALRVPEGRSRVAYNGLPAADLEALARAQDEQRSKRVAAASSTATEEEAPVEKEASEPARVGLVGRLARWKGQHVFLRAAAEVLRRRPGADVRFEIVGGPSFGAQDYEAELHALARELGIEAQVDFLGFQEDIPGVLAELDMLVHASTVPEPFGLVVIEGMAAGLPVVGADAGGVAEIIAPGETGLLYPMGNARALAGRIAQLLGDPAQARRLAQAGQEDVRARFTAEAMARRIERLYDEAVAS